MEKSKIKQTLPCVLTEEEKLSLGQEMAQASRKKAELESSLKEITSQYKAQIVQQENVIQQAARLIHDGYEYRPVDCEVEFNAPERGKKTITRLDTEETHVEIMTMQEKADLFCNVEDNKEEEEDDTNAEN